jgi:hypothetical protein
MDQIEYDAFNDCFYSFVFPAVKFTEPLPSSDREIFTELSPDKDRRIHTQTQSDGKGLNYVIEIGSGAMIYVPIFIKITSAIE